LITEDNFSVFNFVKISKISANYFSLEKKEGKQTILKLGPFLAMYKNGRKLFRPLRFLFGPFKLCNRPVGFTVLPWYLEVLIKE
jgi:hypothetical protein